MFMILERLIALICDEFGMSESDINEDTLIESIVNDEFEMQELMSAVSDEFEIETELVPAEDWRISDLADAISEAE
jgi:hypothetical protein